MKTYETVWLARAPKPDETIQDVIDAQVEHVAATQTVADDIGPAYAAILLIDNMERAGHFSQGEHGEEDEQCFGFGAHAWRIFTVYVREAGADYFRRCKVKRGYQSQVHLGRCQ